MQQEQLMASLRQVQPVLMSRDVEASVRFYAKLGFEVVFRDDPKRARYAGVRREGIELHLQWHDANDLDSPNDRPTYRFVVDDVDQLRAEFQLRGIRCDITEVQDTPWRTREFHVHDPDRNGLQFYRDL
jgi:catechol 2,3-dioxygenase-like lactoylglutathione lyase family enzyme